VLNIALNNPQMEIGDDLREFKEFTKDFSPPVDFLKYASFLFLSQLIIDSSLLTIFFFLKKKKIYLDEGFRDHESSIIPFDS
jgi:hypothetical protein